MIFKIGENVAYPNHGVCRIEGVAKKFFDNSSAEFYSLRLLANHSLIYVPVDNAASIGIRPIISNQQGKRVMNLLADSFEDADDDWKVRTKLLSLKLQTGDIFDAADVLKKLTYLSKQKKLSFREQRLLEKAKFLIVSEMALVCAKEECKIEAKVEELLNCACEHHCSESPKFKTAAAH